MANKDILAVCPFYKKSDRLTVTCEGLIAGTSACQRFRGAKKKQSWTHNYCASFAYEKCLFYQMVEKTKYGGNS